jgi:hypothetical protein
VFAPTNDAILKLGEDKLKKLANQPDLLNTVRFASSAHVYCR